MSLGERIIKAAIGIILLFVIFSMVMNWVGDYREASGVDGQPGGESTGTVEPTDTAEPSAEGEEEAAAQTDAPAATTGKTVTVLVDGLNFRVGASRDSDLIRGLDANEKLVLLAEESGWLKVKDSTGKIGYVSASGSYTRVE